MPETNFPILQSPVWWALPAWPPSVWLSLFPTGLMDLTLIARRTGWIHSRRREQQEVRILRTWLIEQLRTPGQGISPHMTVTRVDLLQTGERLPVGRTEDQTTLRARCTMIATTGSGDSTQSWLKPILLNNRWPATNFWLIGDHVQNERNCPVGFTDVGSQNHTKLLTAKPSLTLWSTGSSLGGLLRNFRRTSTKSHKDNTGIEDDKDC